MVGLGKAAQLLSALFVLVSGLWAVPQVSSAVPALSWLVALFGVLGGLAWLATAAGSK